MELNEQVQKIAISKKGMILLPWLKSNSAEQNNELIVHSFQAEAMRLGYIFDQNLCGALSALTREEIGDLYSQVIPVLRAQKGADKRWKPFYPNFPEQVMETPDIELFCNAIFHYWSSGHWKPAFKKRKRIPVFEDSKFITLRRGTREDFMNIFTATLGSNASISESDRKNLSWFVETYGANLANHLPGNIPFKEQLCAFGSACFQHNVSLVDQIAKTPTDVLRILTDLSGGDISLGSNTKFKSLKRGQRREICRILELVINQDDIARHGEKWKRAFYSLHIGEYRKIAPRTNEVAGELRNGKIRTFYSAVEKAFGARDYHRAIELLSQRPGELARRLDYLFREIPKEQSMDLIENFGSLAERIDTRVMIQLNAHFKTRTKPGRKRVVFPKGQSAKARLLHKQLPPLPSDLVDGISEVIRDSLRSQFSGRSSLGKVWIDPDLKKCPVPLSQRSASDGLVAVARGTRLKLSSKNTLRMFVWWIGRDVDLSAVLYNESFEKTGHISYTNLKIEKINSCHSGDITRAPEPDGAAEFIDIDMDEAEKQGCRYIQMSVYDFTGLTFANYNDCCAGWMTREHPDANEIYDPKFVEQRIDLRTPVRLAIPAVFDLESREAIWMDLNAKVCNACPNNVESNSATLEQIVESSLNLDNKPVLYDLFTLHAESRGELVESKEEADNVFSIEEGITPFSINEILSDYL